MPGSLLSKSMVTSTACQRSPLCFKKLPLRMLVASMAEIVPGAGEAPKTPQAALRDPNRHPPKRNEHGDRAAMLRSEYRADLAWLRAGADDLATYIDGQKMPAPRPDRVEFTSVRRAMPPGATGGHRDDIQERLG